MPLGHIYLISCRFRDYRKKLLWKNFQIFFFKSQYMFRIFSVSWTWYGISIFPEARSNYFWIIYFNIDFNRVITGNTLPIITYWGPVLIRHHFKCRFCLDCQFESAIHQPNPKLTFLFFSCLFPSISIIHSSINRFSNAPCHSNAANTWPPANIRQRRRFVSFYSQLILFFCPAG